MLLIAKGWWWCWNGRVIVIRPKQRVNASFGPVSVVMVVVVVMVGVGGRKRVLVVVEQPRRCY